jgi:hypothetical protein
MAGTASVVESGAVYPNVHEVRIDWTSDASGNATATLPLNGILLQVAFKPSGTAAPTALYDVALTTPAGVDMLATVGANLSATAATQETPKTTNSFQYALSGPYALSVTNAGDTKSGQIWLYLR